MVSRTISLRSRLFQFERSLFQEAPHSPDHLAGTSIILQNIVHDILEFSDVGVWRFRIASAVSAFVRIEPSGWLIS